MQRMEIEAFFAGKAAEMALYDALADRLQRELPSFDWKVQKTQITLVNPRVFCCVSMKWKGSLTVSFGLPSKAESPRIIAASEPYPNRWTHHVKIKSSAEIDKELISWLQASYFFSKQK